MGEVEVGRWSVPAVITSQQVDDARRSLVEIRQHLAPAATDRTLGRVITLLAHYYVADLPPQVQEGIAKDWAEDVGEYPAWALDNACRTWRRSNPRKRPSSGEIRELCQREVSRYRVQSDRLARLIDAAENGAPANDASAEPQPEAWRKPTPQEAQHVGEIVERIKATLNRDAG